MFPKKWVKHEWGECVYYRSILRRYCWNGFAVDILRQVNLCMLQSGYYRLRSILLPGLADDRRIRWHRDLQVTLRSEGFSSSSFMSSSAT